jgi:hypothetical protein
MSACPVHSEFQQLDLSSMRQRDVAISSPMGVHRHVPGMSPRCRSPRSGTTMLTRKSAAVFDQLVNWQTDAVLMSDGVSRSAGLGWFDPKRMKSVYQPVSTYIGFDKPFDVKTGYTNRFLDPSIKMIEARSLESNMP